MKTLIDDQPIKQDNPILKVDPPDEPKLTNDKKTNNGALILVVILAIGIVALMMYLNYKKNENVG